LQVKAGMNEKKKELRILFSDTGRGIPRDYLNKIFLPFFTVDNNPGRHGLGLSFAYQIIKNHDGLLKVESEEGKSTTFTVVLPLRS
jgi:signal transduction histidine kinase